MNTTHNPITDRCRTLSRRLHALLAAVAVLGAVASAGAQEKVVAKGGENWRKDFGPKEVVQRVKPTESDAFLHNPHKGTTTFQRFNGDSLDDPRPTDRYAPTKFTSFEGDPTTLVAKDYVPTTISYCRWVWCDIEPEEGKYRWDIIEGALKAARQRGQTLQVRMQPTASFRHPTGFPKWFLKKVNLPENAHTLKDWNDPVYIKHWTALIAAMGDRFDGHPDFESFDIAYAGPFGEMGGNTTPASAAKLVDAYLDHWKKTPLLGMICTEGAAYAKKKRSIGWRADCFGDLHVAGPNQGVPHNGGWTHMLEEYPRAIVQGGLTDAWKTAPVTLESCGHVGWWYRRGYDIDFILAWGLRNHASVFMPKSCHMPEEWRKKLEAFNKKLGYRFVLRQVTFPLEARPGGKIAFDVYLDNVGVAPIYRDYRLAVRFRQGNVVEIVPFKQDIRKWLPGQTWFREELTFPKTLRPGVVKVDLGIINPKTHKPVVKFAVKENEAGGWMPLNYMDVLD